MACCWPGHPVPMMPNFSSSMPGGSSSPLLDIRVLRLRRHFLASPAEPPIHLTFFHDARWNEPPPVSCYISILPRCRFNSLRFRFDSLICFSNFDSIPHLLYDRSTDCCTACHIVSLSVRAPRHCANFPHPGTRRQTESLSSSR